MRSKCERIHEFNTKTKDITEIKLCLNEIFSKMDQSKNQIHRTISLKKRQTLNDELNHTLKNGRSLKKIKDNWNKNDLRSEKLIGFGKDRSSSCHRALKIGETGKLDSKHNIGQSPCQ